MNNPRARQGISTTSLIQRILQPGLPRPDQSPLRGLLDSFVKSISPPPATIDVSIPHCPKVPRSTGATVAYIGGSWDCFGAGHVEYLRQVRAALRPNEPVMLVVGIWSDEVCENIARNLSGS